MPSLFTTGLAWLHQQRAAHCTEAAAYRTRGSAGTVALRVTASQVKREMLDGNGIPIWTTVQDFITAAPGFDPAAGDIIEYQGRRFEAAEYGEDKCWRYTDSTRLAIRIHTRDIGPVS